jgi:hypothetical protein
MHSYRIPIVHIAINYVLLDLCQDFSIMLRYIRCTGGGALWALLECPLASIKVGLPRTSTSGSGGGKRSVFVAHGKGQLLTPTDPIRSGTRHFHIGIKHS